MLAGPAGSGKTHLASIWRARAGAMKVDANRIAVEAVEGGAVVLKGTVRSWAERQEAERVAWAAPGISRVQNQIVVSP